MQIVICTFYNRSPHLNERFDLIEARNFCCSWYCLKEQMIHFNRGPVLNENRQLYLGPRTCRHKTNPCHLQILLTGARQRRQNILHHPRDCLSCYERKKRQAHAQIIGKLADSRRVMRITFQSKQKMKMNVVFTLIFNSKDHHNERVWNQIS